MECLGSRPRMSKIGSEKCREKVKDILEPFILSDDIIAKIMSTMEEEIVLANSREPTVKQRSSLLWEITFVRCLLDGNENGDYIGLDLGGTNFRVVRVNFQKGVEHTTTKYYNLPLDLLSGPVVDIFGHIARSLIEFLKEENIQAEPGKTVPLGFTFSFPVTQTSLKNSVLLTWTKGFQCTDGVGQDPCILLENAMNELGSPVPVEIVARVNDSTGTLMAGSYKDHMCRIGVILGTGSNACFVENLHHVGNWEGEINDPKQVLINTEWGALGDNGCLDFMRTEYEREVDRHSNHIGSYTFEKSFSGMYLGELTRLVLMRCIEEGVLFNGTVPDNLAQRWTFETSHVSVIESDNGMSTQTKDVFQASKQTMSEDDIVVVREVCAVVSQRAAYIVAAALTVLLKQINLPEVTIAVDGSLYENHPTFRHHMLDLIKKLLPEMKVTFILTKDGSGQGAAFIAAVAQRQKSMFK